MAHTLADVLPPTSASFPREILPLPAALLLVDRDRGLEPMGDKDFEDAISVLSYKAAGSVASYAPAYHNLNHFASVVALTEQLLPPDAPKAMRQALLFAATGHDFGHQGSTFRAQAPKGMPMPELGTDIATEAVSAMLVDEVLADLQVDESLRLITGELILATAFGRAGIGPRTEWERLLCAADVGPCDGVDADIIDWLDGGVNVTFKEVPAKAAPTTFTGWLKNRLGFIQFYLMNFTNPSNPMFVPAAETLGWGKLWGRYAAELQAILDGNNPDLAERMKAQLRLAGAEIDLAA